MGWPSPADYNGAIQNPKAAFRDPKLKDCAVELKPGKPLPWPRAGANAIVYRLYNGSWSTAVRVFMNEPKADRQSRYQMVHAYLQQTKPKCMVEFRLRARRHPGQRPVAADPDHGVGRGQDAGRLVPRGGGAARQRGDQADGPRVDQADLRAPLARDRALRPPARQRHGRGRPAGAGRLRRDVRADDEHRRREGPGRLGERPARLPAPGPRRASSCRRPSTTSPPG